MRRTLLAGVICAVLALAMPGAAGKRFITETDLLKFTWIADPQISPDGSRVVFVRVTVEEKENRYEAALFAVATGNPDTPRRLTSGMRDTSPRWSPDGKRIAFVRSVDKGGHPQPGQIFLLRADGGDARALTDQPNGASEPSWSGPVLIYVAEYLNDEGWQQWEVAVGPDGATKEGGYL